MLIGLRRLGVQECSGIFYVFVVSAKEKWLILIRMSSSSNELLDAKFVGDTILYFHGDLENLFYVKKALLEFCCTSGAMLNWGKIVSVWISNTTPSHWMPHAQLHLCKLANLSGIYMFK
jgi:hypothetical protein